MENGRLGGRWGGRRGGRRGLKVVLLRSGPECIRQLNEISCRSFVLRLLGYKSIVETVVFEYERRHSATESN